MICLVLAKVEDWPQDSSIQKYLCVFRIFIFCPLLDQFVFDWNIICIHQICFNFLSTHPSSLPDYPDSYLEIAPSVKL